MVPSLSLFSIFQNVNYNPYRRVDKIYMYNKINIYKVITSVISAQTKK